MTTGVILLHGVGGNGAGLAPLAATFPVKTFAPDAPEPCGPGRQWFSVAGITEANRPGRIVAARAGLDALIDGFVAREGITRLVAWGFSQGAIMALDALARGKLAEVVAVAGRLAFESQPTPLPGARALLIGGAADGVVPGALSAEAAERLQTAGVATRLILQPGVGHIVTPQALHESLAFLQ